MINSMVNRLREEDAGGNQCSLYLWAAEGLQLVFRLFMGCAVRSVEWKWQS